MCGWDVLVKGVAAILFDRIQGVQASNLSLRGIVNNNCW